jgi:hypothetical protein
MAVTTTRDQRIIERIIEKLAQGKSLTAICEQRGMPSRRTVQRWLQGDDDLAERLHEAREIGFHQFAEQTLDLVEKEPDANRARVILAARQWYLGKLSNAFREKPVQIGVQVNGADAGDAFALVAGALDRAAAAIAGGGTSTQLLVDEGEARSDSAGR